MTVPRQTPAVMSTETRTLLIDLLGAIRDYEKDPSPNRLNNIERVLHRVESLEPDQGNLAKEVIGEEYHSVELGELRQRLENR
ncbi:MAG: hypothetical protein AAB499_00495 [Patescibacteria group bacterium]